VGGRFRLITSNSAKGSEQNVPHRLVPTLDTFVDLEPFGANNGSRSAMAVKIIANPRTERAKRQQLMRSTLARMALEFGYIDAEEDQLYG
jgi:hypothetical protein